MKKYMLLLLLAAPIMVYSMDEDELAPRECGVDEYVALYDFVKPEESLIALRDFDKEFKKFEGILSEEGRTTAFLYNLMCRLKRKESEMNNAVAQLTQCVESVECRLASIETTLKENEFSSNVNCSEETFLTKKEKKEDPQLEKLRLITQLLNGK